jgi:hypothetical protein
MKLLVLLIRLKMTFKELFVCVVFLFIIPSVFAYDVVQDDTIEEIILSVDKDYLYELLEELTGEVPAIIGGESYTITTRHTLSGEPIEKATQYVYEFFEGIGRLDEVKYQNWVFEDRSGRNVIGTLLGEVYPKEKVIVMAHLDNVPSSGRAPGADDNGSGSVGVMVIAEILSNFKFDRTIEFILFTGEEQSFYGSEEYTSTIPSDINVIGAINMDMIGYDGDGNPEMRIYTRRTSTSGSDKDIEMADSFVDVVSVYNLNLIPRVTKDGDGNSDQKSFWREGYPAIFVFEEENDETPDYHSRGDTIDTLDMNYLTEMVRGSMGTAVYMANLISEENEELTIDDICKVDLVDAPSEGNGGEMIEVKWSIDLNNEYGILYTSIDGLTKAVIGGGSVGSIGTLYPVSQETKLYNDLESQSYSLVTTVYELSKRTNMLDCEFISFDVDVITPEIVKLITDVSTPVVSYSDIDNMIDITDVIFECKGAIVEGGGASVNKYMIDNLEWDGSEIVGPIIRGDLEWNGESWEALNVDVSTLDTGTYSVSAYFANDVCDNGFPVFSGVKEFRIEEDSGDEEVIDEVDGVSDLPEVIQSETSGVFDVEEKPGKISNSKLLIIIGLVLFFVVILAVVVVIIVIKGGKEKEPEIVVEGVGVLPFNQQ